MKVKILIGVICFVVGAGAYYLYENNFSLSSKIEKCTNERYLDKYTMRLPGRISERTPEIIAKVDKDILETKEYLKTSLKEKLTNDQSYNIAWQYCEAYAKQYPELIRKQY